MPLTLLSFHHFHSPLKLSALHTLTRTHTGPTSGLYLQGRPGALLISSPSVPALHAYVRAVKRMRWQRVHNLGTSEDQDHLLRLPPGALVRVGEMRGLVGAAGEHGGVGAGEWVRGAVRRGFGGAGGLR
ncbi:uncharacterized protein H6S33_013112 [Morchella sextelata]|uniref:uncharacterized protein n=1 Tax=Morchella sextelata TaxID=1174677 RepID=UPI001D0568C9|nr:uncharacterized protein H6S33_013112 [Morchella sextelata]KAH0609626.1 hypothetical protein H6S33_013112 [Morchella sextelata]